MKIASIIFMLIGILYSGASITPTIQMLVERPNLATLIAALLIFGFVILSSVFPAIALCQISNGKKPPIGIAICVLLFSNFIAGILLLVAKDKDFMLPNNMNNNYNPNMNNYNQPMNNGYNQPMNNGYNNMANNAATNYNAPQQNYNNNNYNNYNNQ